MTDIRFDLKPGDYPIVRVILYDTIIGQESAARLLYESVYATVFGRTERLCPDPGPALRCLQKEDFEKPEKSFIKVEIKMLPEILQESRS
jgi:hypothetical protein